MVVGEAVGAGDDEGDFAFVGAGDTLGCLAAEGAPVLIAGIIAGVAAAGESEFCWAIEGESVPILLGVGVKVCIPFGC